MRLDLYKKACDLLESGRIVINNETEKAVYFTAHGEIGDYSVIIEPNGRHSCTCAQATIHADKEALCSHICAAIALLMFKEKGIKESSKIAKRKKEGIN